MKMGFDMGPKVQSISDPNRASDFLLFKKIAAIKKCPSRLRHKYLRGVPYLLESISTG